MAAASRTTSRAGGFDQHYPRAVTTLWAGCSLVWLYVALRHLSFLFNHFAEPFDFGVFYQAATLLAHGHWNPYISIWGITYYPNWGLPFIANHMEILMWPLALVIRAFPSGFALLVIEALSLASTQFLISHWITKLIWPSLLTNFRRTAFIASIILFIYANAWWLAATSFSFHFQPIAVFLLILTAYLYYYDKHLLSFIAAFLVCLSGVTQALYLVGLGLGLWLHNRNKNRSALVFILSGLMTYAIATSINLNQGTPFVELYGYLGGTTPIQALRAVVRNPLPLLNQIRSNFSLGLALLFPGGVLGILDWLAGPVVLLALIPEWLAGTNQFLTELAAFQTIAVQAFLPIGMAFLFLRILASKTRSRLVAWLLAFTMTVLVAVHMLPQNFRGAYAIDNYVPQQAAIQLSSVFDSLTPNSEVIAPDGIVGRFSGRRYVYPIIAPSLLKFPLWSSTTYIILPKDFTGFEGVPGSYYSQLAAHLKAEHRPGWHVFMSTSSLTVFVIETHRMGSYIDLSS